MKPLVRGWMILPVALGVVAVCIFTLRDIPTGTKKVQKIYEKDVAEGVRIWNPKAGIDSVRIGECRIKKMKSGPISFGGFNVLCVKDLVLNLPLPEDEAEVTNRPTATVLAGVSQSLMRSSGLSLDRVSGIRVSGIEVNRVVGRRTEPVFAAEGLKNRGKTLVLSKCRVMEAGKTNFVAKATLKLSPLPVLTWEGGERRLDDLFVNKKTN